jgi:hypothetical protein
MGAAPVTPVVSGLHEVMRGELRRLVADRGQRQPALARELPYGAFPLGADVREDGDVPPTERRLRPHELEQLRRRAPPRPEATHHPPQQPAELGQLGSGGAPGNTDSSIIVIIK